jgi:outer membrane lipoprotein-sorting protein
MFVVACGYLPIGEPAFIDDALKKVPLPPGTSEFEINGDDSSNFYISTIYTDRSEAEIKDFYRDFFKENGWTSTFPPEEELDGLLDYQKDKAGMNVTTIAVASEIHLMVIYREDEFTREKFDTKVGESTSPEAKALVESVREAYEKATTYADMGTHETIDDGEVLDRATFKTAYKDPGDLLFEHWDSTGDFFFTADVLYKKGNLVQLMSDTDTEPTVEEDVSMAIATLYGVTLGTSGNVPELLLELDGGALFHLIDLKLLKEAKAEDGTLCHRLHGKDFHGHESTIWIGKEDLLIRKIESVESKDNRQTTTYSPKVNIEIADEDLAFRKPVAKN